MTQSVEQPAYILFAGVNGAGKTTLYKSDFWRTNDIPKKFVRINPDETLRDIGGNPSSQKDQIKAAKICVQQLENAFAHKQSVCQETTLCGKGIVKRISQAQNLGYRIVVYYIGIDSPETAKGRVACRASVGGHDVAHNLIEKRYDESLKNFVLLRHTFDCATVFDNTLRFIDIAEWNSGLICYWNASEAYGRWLSNALVDKQRLA